MRPYQTGPQYSATTPYHVGENIPMTTWTNDELTRIGAAEELAITTTRSDGTSRQPLPIWVVRVGDDLYVRSVNGPTAAWFRGAQAHREGHIQAGGVANGVTFIDADPALADQIDAAYNTKYRRYPGIVPRIVRAEARAATIKLIPR
jgi:hypothetical protein